MKKRRVDKNNIDSSFAGYCTDENGRLVKQCAVNWPKLVSIELNELCMHEGLRLEMSGDKYVYISSFDNEVAIVLCSQSTTFNHTKASIWIISSPGLRQRFLRAEFWTRLASIFKSRTVISPILLSMIIWSNSSLRHVCNFLNVTLCTAIILVFTSKSCLLCNNPFDTASHVFNGCMIFNDTYIKRHDRIINHIHSQLTTSRPQFTVYVNRLITGNMLNTNSTQLYANVIHRKPDLLILGDQLKKAYIVEVSSPYDAFVDQCYTCNTKFMYYSPLCELINLDMTYSCKIVIIIIGSTGYVHKKVVPGLKILGFDTWRSKAIAK